MPVVIKKLVVRANIVENNRGNPGMVTDPARPGKGMTSAVQQQLIEESVRQVLAILERQKTR